MQSARPTRRARLFIGVAAAALFAAASPVVAQTPAADQSSATDIVVTGSRIRRLNNEANPVTAIGQAEFQEKGLSASEDLLRALPINSGSVNSPDTTGSPYTVGTAQFNLRGLGLASTLTLINGRRQVVSPIPNDDGSSFVDINTIPLVMVERLEVLQDGAAALYGSDAVAGVANFIMRTKMDGVEMRGGFQTTTKNRQEDYTLGIVGGTRLGNWDVVAGVEYIKRTPLAMADRPFTNGKIRSALGFPGAFAPTGSPPLIDRNCAAAGGIPTPIVAGRTDIGFCGSDLTKNFDLISPEERVTGYASVRYDFGTGMTLYGELGGAYNTAKIRSANFSNLKFPIVPATNPGNLVANGGFGVPVTYFGRPRGNLGDVNQSRTNTMVRGVIGLEGDVGKLKYDVNYTYAQQFFAVDGVTDTKGDRFLAALNCQGGPSNNLCFNPFGSSVTNPALGNSPAVIADFTTDSFRRYTGRLHAIEAVLSGNLFDLPAGPVGFAIGGQYRRESLAFRSDRDAQTGNLVFIFTGADFKTRRSIIGLFGELAVPLAKGLDAQLAARFERYSDGSGSSFNPKASLRWQPARWVTLRGSVGTSFRAPSQSQTTSISTINESISDPLNPAPIGFFRAVVTVPSALRSETATNYNAGIIIQPTSAIRLSVDYWRYDYRDIIIKQNAQAVVTANPRDPRVIRPLGPTGPISQVLVSFQNQASVLTDGIDIAASMEGPIGGNLRGALTTTATYINKYVTDIGAGREDLAGLRNFQNFARSLPRWRSTTTGTLSFGQHAFSTTFTFIDSYRENVLPRTSPVNGFKVGNFATFDFQYALQLKQTGSTIRIGVLNAFDKYPPTIAAPGDLQGFDRLIHDPRGRMFYVKLQQNF